MLLAFGKNLRSIRKEKKLSMEELAGMADVEYSQIARIEKGKLNTTISTAFALAKALEIPFEKLFQF